MTAKPSNWRHQGRIHANDRTAIHYKDTARIYRVRDNDGRILALGYPTAGVIGELISLERIAPMERSTVAGGVGTHPFSQEVTR